tara:strand:- start:2779 stop:4770 length:1992 start_codon:yes stop_codon:yes gene_type:complete
MKSKLSNRGYIIIKEEYSDKEIKKIKKELNVSPYSPYQSKFIPPPSYPIYLESKRKLYLPRYWALDNLEAPEKFCIKEGTSIDIKFTGSLRPVQEEAVSAYMKNCYPEYGGGILCLGCGFGKTIISLYLLSMLKKKTLVIVHKEFLLNQWIERIKAFLPDAQVGRIQAKTFDIAGKDIVIGMLQSLSMKEFEEGAFDSFGTVIVDECFVGDTLVYTTTGLRTIEYLYNQWKNSSNTSYISSYNKETGLFENKKMTFGWKKTTTNLLEINVSDIIIKCTSNHKILTNEGYIEAKNLDISKHIVHTINDINDMNEADDINKLGKNIKYIKNIENVENIYVYDIEVEDNHNYIVTDNDHCNNYTRTYKGFIVSNCHHISSEVFSRSLPKVSFKYTIGLTATPNRADGLQKVFEWFLGPIVYKSKGGKQHDVFVKVIQIDDSNNSYSKIEEGYDGKPITARMITNVANYIPRTSVIIREVQKIMEEPGRKILLLSDRRDHLKYIHAQLTEKGFDVGFYVGGMKQKDLDISETKPIILGTFSMSSEALDIPELNTLFMTTPKSNIEQSVGRILRKTHEIRPLIIDIKDNFRPFLNQSNKRKAFYKKCKYEVYDFTVKPNEMEEVLEKNKNIHKMTCNIIDDLNETDKPNSKKKEEQIKIDECMFSDDD